jgi:hypothetical protein
MNAGQSPFMHEKSKLHEPWSMRSCDRTVVSTGCTDRQLLFAPQSPQPSHTRSLMTTRKPGVAILSRLRSRRFSAAHRWSWISTVQPGTSANTSCASISRLRPHSFTPTGSSMER